MNEAIAAELAGRLLMAGFPGREIDDHVRELVRRGVRSFVLFARNIDTADSVRKLTDDLRELAGEDACIAIDHEGGLVNRMPAAATRFPSAMAMAAAGDLGLLERCTQSAGSELRALGIGVNFAPVADVMAASGNPVLGTRLYSDDPECVADCVEAAVRGYARGGVVASAKHFPGHGATETDSHVDLPVVRRSLDELRRNDLVPFARAVGIGVPSIMISHVWYTALDGAPTPATCSSAVMRLARDELHFEGVIFTDCMEMGAITRTLGTSEAVVRSLQAGVDVPIVSHTLDLQVQTLQRTAEAIAAGEIEKDRIAAAMERVQRMREFLRMTPKGPVRNGANLAPEVARKAITVLQDAARLLPLRADGLGRLLVVTGTSGVRHELHDSRDEDTVGLVREFYSHVEHVLADGAPASVRKCREMMASMPALVVTPRHASLERRQSWLRDVVPAEGAVVVVGTGDPRDVLAVPPTATFVAAYDPMPVSLRAALEVIAGERQATGRAPLAIAGTEAEGEARA